MTENVFDRIRQSSEMLSKYGAHLRDEQYVRDDKLVIRVNKYKHYYTVSIYARKRFMNDTDNEENALETREFKRSEEDKVVEFVSNWLESERHAEDAEEFLEMKARQKRHKDDRNTKGYIGENCMYSHTAGKATYKNTQEQEMLRIDVENIEVEGNEDLANEIIKDEKFDQHIEVSTEIKNNEFHITAEGINSEAQITMTGEVTKKS